MKQTYTCPECQDDIECDENAKDATCSSCKSKFVIEHDADHDEGVWRDRTKLIPKGKCCECSNEIPNDIWKDSNVMSALKEGRSADDIMVIRCPKCDRFNYYNQGSSYWCKFCKQGWVCLSEGEEPPVGRQYLYLDGMESPVTLADTLTETTEGYHNETQ